LLFGGLAVDGGLARERRRRLLLVGGLVVGVGVARERLMKW